MPQLKPHLTVQQIAKKHRLDVSFIQNQLKMGEPIEHEHTKNHTLAMDIALQHLDEIPDYYTRLKKMEASAKKEHKKFKDVKESNHLKENEYDDEYDDDVPLSMTYQKRYCPACKKEEFKSDCKQGGRYWDMFSMPVKLKNTKESMESPKGIVADILKTLSEEDPCWKGYTQVGMKNKGGKKVPNCVPSKGVPKAKGYKTEETKCPKCSGKKCKCESPQPDEYNDRQLKEIGESIRLPAVNGNILSIILSWRGRSYMTKMFFPQVKMPSRSEITDQIQKVYPGATILQYNLSGLESGQPLIQIVDKSKNYLLNNKTIGEETKVAEKPATKDEKRKIALMQKLARLKAAAKATSTSSDVATKEEFELEEVAAWQRKEGKNPEGGLNKKGIASYRKEHPGSKLSLAVTTPPSKLKPGSKSANRRKSFCARMGGMPGPMKDEKGRPTRKALSLRKWNC